MKDGLEERELHPAEQLMKVKHHVNRDRLSVASLYTD